MTAEPGQAAVEKIENKRAQNEPDRFVKQLAGRYRVATLQKRALQNPKSRGEAAKQIAGGHQVRQQINFRRLFVHDSGRRAIIVDPPATCSPTVTCTLAVSGKYTS